MSKNAASEVFTLGPTEWHTGTEDPSSSGFEAPLGSWYIRVLNGYWYRKHGAADTDWVLVTGGSSAFYGLGTAGNVTLPVGTTTLTADMFYDTLVVPSGAVLIPDGFHIYCMTELRIEAGGIIRSSGSNATTFSGAAAASSTGPIAGGTAGGSGATAAGSAGTAMTRVPDGQALTVGLGGAGGAGSSGAGGAPSSAYLSAASNYSRRAWDGFCMLNGSFCNYTIPQSSVANGGGGGGGDGVNRGGGGGGAAGRIVVAALRFRNDGQVDLRGGNGAPGQGGNTGGGGGGGGGQLWLLTRQRIGSGTVELGGGTGGAGSGTGTAGAAGNPGMTIELAA
jgi:hypothetical protein